MRILPLLVFSVLLPSCGSSSEGDFVNRESFEKRGLNWPLTVDEAKLGCTKLARWAEVDGVKYGLNGLASEERGYTDIGPIWSIDERTADQFREAGVEPLKVNIGDMISEAGKLCNE